MTVHNTLATSATSIYIRDTTTEDDNGMLTSETFPAITTQSTPFIVKDISSSTSENVKSAILSVKTETSTPARTGMQHVDNIDSMYFLFFKTISKALS